MHVASKRHQIINRYFPSFSQSARTCGFLPWGGLDFLSESKPVIGQLCKDSLHFKLMVPIFFLFLFIFFPTIRLNLWSHKKWLKMADRLKAGSGNLKQQLPPESHRIRLKSDNSRP